MTLGEYIKQYRYEHDNMSIRQFGRISDLSATYIKKLEVGVNKDNKPISPTIETFGKVASAAGITLDELFSVVTGNVIINSKSGYRKSQEVIYSPSSSANENKSAYEQDPEYVELIELYKIAPESLRTAAMAVLKSYESHPSTQGNE